MKIGISLPDEVFRQVEREAKRLGISRSELLSRAAVDFLSERRGREITLSYNLAFAPSTSRAPSDDAEDRFRREAARRALREVEW